MIRYHWDAVIGRYYLVDSFSYFSVRYVKSVYLPAGYKSDGATGAVDISSIAWWVHDYLCDYGKFSDGSKCSNWQASSILHDILLSEGRWFRAHTWRWATFLFGGGEARKNGLW